MLVYVLSTGRSGSTLLEMLLASHPEVTTLGELQLLGHLRADDRAACACGRPLSSCAFWAPILEDLERAGPLAPDRFREHRRAGRVLRPELVPDLLLDRRGPRARREAAAYAVPTVEVVEAAAAATGARMVVDASKDVYRLHLLRAGGLDIRVVLLVRDPRGFVSSMIATDRSAGVRRVARLAARWLAQNVLFTRSCAAALRSGRARRVRYEDLAAHPEAVLTHLGRWLGIDPDGFDVAGFRSHGSHALAGNPMRGGDDPVVLDTRWQHALGRGVERVVWLIDGPLARRYGYHRDPGAP